MKKKPSCTDTSPCDACHDKANALFAMTKPSRLAATKPIEACNDNDQAKVKLAMKQPRNACCGKASSFFCMQCHMAAVLIGIAFSNAIALAKVSML